MGFFCMGQSEPQGRLYLSDTNYGVLPLQPLGGGVYWMQVPEFHSCPTAYLLCPERIVRYANLSYKRPAPEEPPKRQGKN